MSDELKAALARIACLEGEIAKRDARIVELESGYTDLEVDLASENYQLRAERDHQAQWIGELLPTTHFIRITRGIMLRGNSFTDIWPELWPLLLFTALVMAIGLRRFRRTLD